MTHGIPTALKVLVIQDYDHHIQIIQGVQIYWYKPLVCPMHICTNFKLWKIDWKRFLFQYKSVLCISLFPSQNVNFIKRKWLKTRVWRPNIHTNEIHQCKCHNIWEQAKIFSTVRVPKAISQNIILITIFVFKRGLTSSLG